MATEQQQRSLSSELLAVLVHTAGWRATIMHGEDDGAG